MIQSCRELVSFSFVDKILMKMEYSVISLHFREFFRLRYVFFFENSYLILFTTSTLTLLTVLVLYINLHIQNTCYICRYTTYTYTAFTCTTLQYGTKTT